MTVPADAYVSFTAGEAARTILALPERNPSGEVVAGRTHGFLVIVARGAIAAELEAALSIEVAVLDEVKVHEEPDDGSAQGG